MTRRVAAETWGLNKSAFIENVYQQTLVGLAAIPTTLFFLLEEFRQNGAFRGTHRELYERGCQRLMREIDPRRIEALRLRRHISRLPNRQHLAESVHRLAALLLLCGKSAIHTGPSEEADADSDLHISEAADTDLTEDSILDAIATGLFTSRGRQRFGFAHQTFAEMRWQRTFYRASHSCKFRSLLSVGTTHNQRICNVPQLAETAAWVAGGPKRFL